MKTDDILSLMQQEYTWEQILYQVVAWEGMNPWDLDISALSGSFLKMLNRMELEDFRVPAKFVILAAVLLRMKSDHLRLIDEEPEAEVLDGGMEGPVERIQLNPLSLPPIRNPVRKLTIADLVISLRRVFRAENRKTERLQRTREVIQVKQDDITHRIAGLYNKINSLLGRLQSKEVPFSTLVEKWERMEVANTFMPLVYLDHEQRVRCRQDEIFDEIFIQPANGNSAAPGLAPVIAKPRISATPPLDSHNRLPAAPNGNGAAKTPVAHLIPALLPVTPAAGAGHPAWNSSPSTGSRPQAALPTTVPATPPASRPKENQQAAPVGARHGKTRPAGLLPQPSAQQLPKQPRAARKSSRTRRKN